MHPALNIAIKAALRAGKIINRASNDLDLLKVETKQPNDFVTEVDRKAEATIIDTLHDAYPQYGILAEESGATAGKGAVNGEYRWIIDPLDGTTNFIHGLPQYAISIALEGRERVPEILKQCQEVDEIEARAVEVMRLAITHLFEKEGDEAAAWHAMKMRGFYFMQEAVLDHCKRAAKTLEEILLENA